jgi:prepilin-type processing-associated H-X9-DG protein
MESFSTTRLAGLRENLLVGAGLLVAVPLALFLLRGERDPALLAGFGAGGAVASVLLYSLRDAWLGRRVVELTAEEIRVRGRRGEERLAWAEVASAVHTLRGGERWVLKPHAGGAMVLWLDGFTPAQSRRIGEQIREHTQARGAPPRNQHGAAP